MQKQKQWIATWEEEGSVESRYHSSSPENTEKRAASE
jgi:hypothetical protein